MFMQVQYTRPGRFGAAVFDLDGTLINSLRDLADSTNYALNTLGYPTYPVDRYRYLVGSGVAKLIIDALPEGAREDETIRAKVRALFDEYYGKNYLRHTRPYDGVDSLLKSLKARGMRLAVVSNKPDAFVKELVGTLFGGVFDTVSGQKEGVPRKPDPAGALLAAKEMDVPPSECVYLGDSGVDMETAVAAGMFPVGALWGFRTEDELQNAGAKACIEAPGVLLDLL